MSCYGRSLLCQLFFSHDLFVCFFLHCPFLIYLNPGDLVCMQLTNWLNKQCVIQLNIVYIDAMHANTYFVTIFGFEKPFPDFRARDPVVQFLAFNRLASL